MTDVLAVVLGVALVAATLWSAVATVILPRAAQSRFTRWVFFVIGRTFRSVAGLRDEARWRDRVMAPYAPIVLLAVVGWWMAATLAGFTMIFKGIDSISWAEAYHRSGSSLTTLGFAPVDGTLARTVAFVEASLGLVLVALLISYLPTLYTLFGRRETQVALLEVRAGLPPSAAEMLLRFHRIGWQDSLAEVWVDWERWFAEVEESHSSYPVLAFFRSPMPQRHWVTAAGTILDAASITQSAVVRHRDARASLVIRAGFLALRRVADTFGIDYDPDPAPDDPISISREEFDQVVDRLAAEGMEIEPDRDRAWRDFAGWRVNYDTVLLALADLTMAPYAPWTSDRSGPSRRRTRLRRFGRRALQ